MGKKTTPQPTLALLTSTTTAPPSRLSRTLSSLRPAAPPRGFFFFRLARDNRTDEDKIQAAAGQPGFEGVGEGGVEGKGKEVERGEDMGMDEKEEGKGERMRESEKKERKRLRGKEREERERIWKEERREMKKREKSGQSHWGHPRPRGPSDPKTAYPTDLEYPKGYKAVPHSRKLQELATEAEVHRRDTMGSAIIKAREELTAFHEEADDIRTQMATVAENFSTPMVQ
ncbi:hypothetical protein K402DRAFT_423785 [Aulographum hederae CBS 113979]|uniref:Uncharacterized protein n=1 Tax=Aulographum hederae CBS 113979 TaxID=1176131 RepID=A0A6G1GRS2_9PEZI|nr:hypothetical protein K402DRAFT_423785 [Aulographum hederae CBS 113979]